MAYTSTTAVRKPRLAETLEEMLNDAAANKIIDNKVIALGGIDASHIQALKEWHFGGAAFLGDIWNRIDDKDVDNYLDYLSHLLKG